MFIHILSLQHWPRVVALVFFSATSLIGLAQLVNASPGAHGPNGEHLDTSSNFAVSVNPKFESFTETFELLGELFEEQLVIYLHDFKSNVPVQGATIALESGNLSATAEYSDRLKAYSLTDQAMMALLNKEGEHEIVLTIMTDDNGDLLSAHLTNIPSHTSGEEHEEEHHHDLPWRTVFLSIAIFSFGFLLGRLRKGKQL